MRSNQTCFSWGMELMVDRLTGLEKSEVKVLKKVCKLYNKDAYDFESVINQITNMGIIS